MKQTNVVTMLTENPNGVLGRIIALFGRHGVTIDSLSVSATAEQGVSRITVTTGCARSLTQLALQARRLVDIRQVTLLEGGARREVLEVKLQRAGEGLDALARRYGAAVLTAADGCPVLECADTPAVLDALLAELEAYRVAELSRTVVAAPALRPAAAWG